MKNKSPFFSLGELAAGIQRTVIYEKGLLERRSDRKGIRGVPAPSGCDQMSCLKPSFAVLCIGNRCLSGSVQDMKQLRLPPGLYVTGRWRLFEKA